MKNFRRRETGEDQKKQNKGLRRNLRPFSEGNLIGSFSPSWLFFLWSSRAQLSVGGRLNLCGGTLNLDGGTLTFDGGMSLPYNLSSARTVLYNAP